MTETTLVRHSRHSTTPPPARQCVNEAVRGRLAQCPYAFIFSKVSWRVDEGQLTLHGSVPTYYLKQMLQEHLRNLPEIGLIKNEVQVVSATGLSSESARRFR